MSSGIIPQEWTEVNSSLTWKNLHSDFYKVKSCLGRIMQQDVGKKYVIKNDIANVENDEQFKKRVHPVIKVRMPTWYWGNYVTHHCVPSGFELYQEEKHGWIHSEEYKSGMKEPYPHKQITYKERCGGQDTSSC